MKKDNRRYIVLGLLILYIVVMMIGFLIFIPKNLSVLSNNDKLIHFAEFFVLTVLALKTFQLFKFKHHYILGALFCVFFIVLSESLQSLVPYRSFSYYDMLADVIGIIVGIGVFKWIFSKLSF
jgi:VanZ family protein